MNLIIGIVIGILVGLGIAVFIMRKLMLVHYELPGRFEDVEKAIQETIPSFPGWGFPISDWQFYQSQRSKGLTYKNIRNMVMHFVCKPQHANEVLSVDPNLGGIMPCTWAVYEKADGGVYIAKMNIALMCKMYFGRIGAVMRDVARTEEAMLAQIRDRLRSKAA